MFSKVVRSNRFIDPSSDPVIIFLSGNLQTTYTVLEWPEGNDADFAIFFALVNGTLAKTYKIAFGFVSFWLSMEFEVLWRVISKGPAWANLV